jgi:hypothetical protein
VAGVSRATVAGATTSWQGYNPNFEHPFASSFYQNAVGVVYVCARHIWGIAEGRGKVCGVQLRGISRARVGVAGAGGNTPGIYPDLDPRVLVRFCDWRASATQFGGA